jgi:glutamate-1-semialdehyde 2,1-aminomutase
MTETRWNWHIRAQDSIAHAALTNSKRPESLVKGVYPTHAKSGRGCRITDADDRTFIDFICGLGSNLLGYGNDEIAQVISARAHLGASLSLASTLEVEVAEKVKEVFPVIEKLRFLKTGTDACNAALRIARAKTGRKIVYSEGYHGWGDEFVSMTPPGLGTHTCSEIRKLTHPAQVDSNTAAVIVEPIMVDDSPQRIEWLRELQGTCKKQGALLIFDEIITGLRFPKFSASAYYGFEPDLICLGKSLANGMPISVVGGKKDVMECGEWFVSSTFAGETLSLAAAQKTLHLLQTKYNIQDLWDAGRKFQSNFNAIWPEGLVIEGYPTRGILNGDALVKALFMQEACLSGIIFGPSWFISFAHIDVIDSVLSTCRDILIRIKMGGVHLYGEMPRSPFAQQVREQK